jgi:hypothetical protein
VCGRKESRECYFSAMRRKRKHEAGRADSLDGYEYTDEYIVRNGRQIVHGSPPGRPEPDMETMIKPMPTLSVAHIIFPLD